MLAVVYLDLVQLCGRATIKFSIKGDELRSLDIFDGSFMAMDQNLDFSMSS